MSTDRDQNGPTQVHPALNNVYNDLTSHMQLNGLNGLSNGLNGLSSMSKPFAERGETGLEAFLPQKSRTKIFQEDLGNFFHYKHGACAAFPPNFPYRVAFAVSSNGSNFTVTRLTPFRLTSFTCLAMAAMSPPDRVNTPE